MSFQNRLSYFSDKRGAKMVQNDIVRSGYFLDLIHVRVSRDAGYNEINTQIESFQFLPVVMPIKDIENMEVKYGRSSDGSLVPYLTQISEDALQIYATSKHRPIERDDILFWIIENYMEGVEPAILVLRVKQMNANFGSYGIIFNSYTVTTEDPSRLPTELVDKLRTAHEKRQFAVLAEHQREQLS